MNAPRSIRRREGVAAPPTSPRPITHGRTKPGPRRTGSTRTRLLLVLNAALVPPAASAHEFGPAGAAPLTPATWTHAWSWPPGIVAGLFLLAALYVAGVRHLRDATGSPRKLRAEAFSFGAGWLFLVVALLSPVHPLGTALFSVHMIQHELLMVAAAPLLVLGRPWLALLWALPRSTARQVTGVTRAVGRSGIGRALAHPAVAWALHASALWAWHVPRWFNAARAADPLHAFQHACFLGSAVWFWHAVFYGPQRRAGFGLAVVYLFTTALHTGALGALITFGGGAWYADDPAALHAWGLTPPQDQQLGGLIMWVPGGLTYVIAALALFAAWLRESEHPSSPRRPVLLHPTSPCVPSPFP